MADKITIEFNAETREAIANLAKLKGATAKVSEEAEKSSLKFADMRAAASSTYGAIKGFASTVAGAAAATAGLVAGVTLFAARAEQQERAVTRLGAAYDAVQAATRGTVTAQQALQLQQSIVQSGVQVSAQQMGVLTRAAREYADATGTDLSQALDKVTNAIVNNSEDALQEFGLASARATTSTRTLANATRELEHRQRGMAPAVRTLNEDLAKLPQSLSDVGSAMLRAAEGPFNALAQRILGISNATGQFREALRLLSEFGDDTRANARGAADLATRERRRVARQGLIDTFTRRGLVTGGVRVQDITEEEANTLSTLARTGATQSEIEGALSSLRQQRATIAARPAPAATRRPAARAAGSGGGRGNELRAAIRGYQNAIAEAPDGAVIVTPSDLAQNPRESATAYYNRLAEIQGGFNSAGAVNDLAPVADSLSAKTLENAADLNETAREREIASRGRSQRMRDRDRETRRSARGQSVLGRVEDMAGLQRDEAGNLRPIDAASEGIGLLGKALPTLQSGFAEMWTTIADGSASAGDAVQAFAAKSLQALGQIAIQEGTAMLFKAIPAAFTAPPLAVAYGVGGAGLIALGVGLGAAGAAIKPPPASTGAASTGSARAASGTSQSSASAGAPPVTIVLSSLVPPGPGELQRLVDAGSQAGRYNLDRRRDMVPRAVRA